MKTYAEIEQMVYLALGDPSQATYESALVYMGIEAAHYAICPWIPKMSTKVLTSGSTPNTLDTFVLPSDVYDLLAVREDDTDLLLPKATLDSNELFGSVTTNDKFWILNPHGYLVTSWEITSGDTLSAYYMASWTPPISGDDTAIVEIPLIAVMGAIYYAASQCLSAKSSVSSQIRQFNIKVDSGVPTNNPLMDSAKYYYDLFLNHMKLMPIYGRPVN